jgi:carbon-monoxide dehydrogenase large subunit
MVSPMQDSVQTAPEFERYGVGQPVLRKEDDTLLRGKGTYTDDLQMKGQVYEVLVRSTHAHGKIKSIDIEAAAAMPGVLAVILNKDLVEAGYGVMLSKSPLKNRDGSSIHPSPRSLLAHDRVRFVGEPIAAVIAETPAQARDAAEAVAVEIEPLPAVTSARDAAQPGAPLLYDDVPNNVVLDFHTGDAEKTAEALAKAAHVTTLTMDNTRVVPNPIEPRAALAVYDKATERYTLYFPNQGVAGNKNTIAGIMNVEPSKIRVVAKNVGGSFGMKGAHYPEYYCALYAAKKLGKPVKWLDDRSGSFLSDHHGRASLVTGELGFDADGQIVALRVTSFANMGSQLALLGPVPATINLVKNAASVYRTPLIEASVKCVVTNTPLVSAYRGAGRPEGNYFMERLLDKAAREMNVDRVALRKKNVVKPTQLPFNAASGMVYDSGDFLAVLDHAVKLGDYAGFAKRKRESKKSGKLRGIAVSSFLEVTAPPGKELGKIVFEADGTVSLITGTYDYGMGHHSPFAQILVQQLGIPFEAIKLIQTDSDLVRMGGGSGGSRSVTTSGQAIVEASAIVIDKGKKAAAHVLEAAEADVEFARGRFTIAGTDRGIGIMELAAKLHQGGKLPEGVPVSLDVDHTSTDVPSAFPNGAHVAEVEVDPDTGTVAIVRYTGINDFGTIINPMIVDGQVHGGVTQGVGQALMEVAMFDAEGQPITGSFMDYAMPRAEDVPMFTTASQPSPAKTNPLGTKGCGEAGCAGALPTIVNAVLDAVADEGVTSLDMPLTAEKLWRAIKDARANKAA